MVGRASAVLGESDLWLRTEAKMLPRELSTMEGCVWCCCASAPIAAKGSEPQEPAIALTVGMLAEVIFKESCLRGQLVEGPGWGKRRVSVKLIRALIVNVSLPVNRYYYESFQTCT